VNKDLIKLYIRSFLSEGRNGGSRVPLQQFSSASLEALKSDQMLVPHAEDEIDNEDEL